MNNQFFDPHHNDMNGAGSIFEGSFDWETLFAQQAFYGGSDIYNVDASGHPNANVNAVPFSNHNDFNYLLEQQNQQIPHFVEQRKHEETNSIVPRLNTSFSHPYTPPISSSASISGGVLSSTYSADDLSQTINNHDGESDTIDPVYADKFDAGCLPLDESLNRIPPARNHGHGHTVCTGYNTPLPPSRPGTSGTTSIDPQHLYHQLQQMPHRLSITTYPHSQASPGRSSPAKELHQLTPTTPLRSAFTNSRPGSQSSNTIRMWTPDSRASIITQINSPSPLSQVSPAEIRDAFQSVKPTTNRAKPIPSFEDGKGQFSIANGVARRKYDPIRKEEVKKTRAEGACIRCARQKISCKRLDGAGDEEPCIACSARHTKEDVNNIQLCFKISLQEVGIFRIRSALHDDSMKKPITWISQAITTLEIRLTGQFESTPLRLDCRHYQPDKGDVTKRLFGASCPIEIPPYAATDIEGYKRDLKPMLRSFCGVFYSAMVQQGCSPTVARVLNVAMRFAARKPDSIVSMALDIWTGSRLCATEKSLVGTETLGMETVEEQGSLRNIRPVPPKIDNQTDTAVIEIMSETATQMMKKLRQKIIDRKRKDWFEIFLTLFIIINNVEYVIGKQEAFLHDWQNVTAAPDERNRCVANSCKFIEEWTWSAKKLIHIYQEYCRKKFPFTRKACDSAMKEADLNREEASLVTELIYAQETGQIASTCKDTSGGKTPSREMEWGARLFEPPP